MSRRKNVDESRDDGSYVVKKSRRSNILAFIVCLLIAFVIWAVAESVENSEQTGGSGDAAAQTALADATGEPAVI